MNKLLEKSIFSVSEYIEFLNNVLEGCGATIQGEVGQVKVSSAGHVYFSLKDEKDNSTMDCVIWNFDYRLCGIKIEEGLKVLIKGMPSIYNQSGRFSFKVKTIQLVGEGELKKQYDELRVRLEKEGVFERQMPLPELPQKIGLITSKHGAVIHDFLNNLDRRNFQISFIDSRVEGVEALEDLLYSIRTFKKKDIDVLVVMRGGGAMEAFLPFNNEKIIREIVNFPLPVISGLGHHKDEPLFALASDYSLSTPTAVANLLNNCWGRMVNELELKEQKIFDVYSRVLMDFNYKMSVVLNSFELMGKEIKDKESFINEIGEDVFGRFSNLLNNKKERISFFEKIVQMNNPERHLRLGYAIPRMGDKIIRSRKDLQKGDLFNLEVIDGIINSKVEKAYEKRK